MSNSTVSASPVAMVAADKVVYTGLATVSKVIGAGAIAKSQGSKASIVKAQHYAKQGAALAFASSITGKGRAATVSVYAGAELSDIVNSHGVIDNYRAVTTVAAVLQESLTFEESIRADGQRVVKRAFWLSLGQTLESVIANPETPKAKANRYTDALKVYNAIQARADANREIKALT